MKVVHLVNAPLLLAISGDAASLRGLQQIGNSFGGGVSTPANPSCTNNSDCPTINCFVAPCDNYICVENTCVLDVDREDNGNADINVGIDARVPCQADTDCPEVQCIREPCDTFFCIQNFCTLVLDRIPNGPSGDNNDTINIGDSTVDTDNTIEMDFFETAGEKCGSVTCPEGEVCCNASCGTCVEPGGRCPARYCQPVEDEDQGITSGEECGGVTCGVDEFCCNRSCGICAKVGGACTEQYCGDFFDFFDNGVRSGEECGPVTCEAGQICCNESCGICTEPGGGCTKQICDEDDGGIPDEEEEELEDSASINLISFSRGECECPEQCSVCKGIFGVCMQMFCT